MGDVVRRYKALTRDMLRERLQGSVLTLAAVLDTELRISNSRLEEVAEVLLRYFSWSYEAAKMAWRSMPKLLKATMKRSLTWLRCSRCNDGFYAGRLTSAGCSHYYCDLCWGEEVHKAIDGGLKDVALQCPDQRCSSQVPMTREVVEMVADDIYMARYDALVVRSYVEHSRGRFKWCPAGPDRCGKVVEYGGAGPDDSTDVFCDSKHGFCWDCRELPHWPVPCDRRGTYRGHYERWEASDMSLWMALYNVNEWNRTGHPNMARRLSRSRHPQAAAATSLAFLTRAYEQVAECQRAFGWVHAYRHTDFLTKRELVCWDRERERFEQVVEEASASLERLRNCTDEETRKLSVCQPDDLEKYLACKRKVTEQAQETEELFRQLAAGVRTDGFRACLDPGHTFPRFPNAM